MPDRSYDRDSRRIAPTARCSGAIRLVCRMELTSLRDRYNLIRIKTRGSRMERLKQALEELDEALFALEDKFVLDTTNRRETVKRQNDIFKQQRQREVEILATTQKVAARLDHTIEHVERILYS